MNPPLTWIDSQLTAADVGIWASVASRFGRLTETMGMGIYHTSMRSDARDHFLMEEAQTLRARGFWHSIHFNGIVMTGGEHLYYGPGGMS